MAGTSRHDFRMMVERVVHLRQWPGLYVAGKISSGTVRTGDHLILLDGETVVREVTCDNAEFLDVDRRRPELALVAVHVRSLLPGDVSEG